MNENAPIQDPVATPAQYDLASRPRRLLGQVLDSLVAYVPIFVALALDNTPLFIAAWFLAALYILLADGLPGGQSLGKKVLGMRVIDEKSGRECSFGNSFLRNIMLTFLGPIDWIFIFGKKHQRLGDKAANTIVVNLS